MEWNQARFVKLRLADHKAVGCDVVHPQVEGLGYTQTGRGQQTKQSAISAWHKRVSKTMPRSALHQPCDVIPGKDEGYRPSAGLFAESAIRWNFVSRIFGMRI